jgi:hypothetical protein
MTLVVEDGTGLSTAESYISVADTDAYLTSIGDPGAWSAVSTQNKEIALRKATAWIDNTFRKKWKGTRANASQALAWPRANVEDQDGFAVESTSVPTVVERATAEAAYRFVTTNLDADISSENVGVTGTMDKVGPLQTEVKYVGGVTIGDKEYVKIDGLLSGVTHSVIRMERG